MTEDTPLTKARASLVWIAALLVAFGSVWWIERESGRALIAQPAAQQPRHLTADELARAQAAWAWFEQHAEPATAADARFALVATVAARELALAEPAVADARLARIAGRMPGLPAQGPTPAARSNATLLESLALIQRGATPTSP